MNFEINSNNSSLETIFNYLKRDLLLNNNNTININISINNKKKKSKNNNNNNNNNRGSNNNKNNNNIEFYDSFLFILPNEIFSKILSLLDYKDIIALSFINNHFYTLINSYNSLWKKLYFKKYKNHHSINHFNFCKDLPYCGNDSKYISNSNNCISLDEISNNDSINQNNKINIYNINNNNNNYKSKYLNNKKVDNNWKRGKYSVTSLDTNIGGIFCLSQKDNMLVTGSFDRELKLWKMAKDKNDKILIEPVVNIKGHDGWIWSAHLKRSNNFHKMKCISSSQDGTIMIGDINKDEFDQMETFGNNLDMDMQEYGSSSGNDSNGTNNNKYNQQQYRNSSNNNNNNNNNINNINYNNRPKSINLKQIKQQQLQQQQNQHLQIASEFPTNQQKPNSFIDGTFLKGHKGVCWTTIPDKQLNYLYSGGGDSLIKQWDIERASFVTDIGKHNESILCLSGTTSEHPNLLASGSADHSIRLWDIRAPSKMILCINEHGVNIDCLALSNHFIVSGGDDGVLRISDIRLMINSPRPYVIAEIPAHDGSIRALSIKRNKMVTTSSDMSIKIWQINKMNSTPSNCLLGHHGSVVSMQLKNDMIISGSLDSTVKIWDYGILN